MAEHQRNPLASIPGNVLLVSQSSSGTPKARKSQPLPAPAPSAPPRTQAEIQRGKKAKHDAERAAQASRVRKIELDLNLCDWLDRMKTDHELNGGKRVVIRKALELYRLVPLIVACTVSLFCSCSKYMNWKDFPPEIQKDTIAIAADAARRRGDSESNEMTMLHFLRDIACDKVRP